MIEETSAGCDWKSLGDITSDALAQHIGRKRSPSDECTKAWTPRTAHKCTAVRTFTRWCVSDGRLLDFHALRHTCGAWAAIGGASPKAIQTLMRHSKITLTLDTYGHLLRDEAADTVGKLPNFESLPLRLTGTTDERWKSATEVPAVDPATRTRLDASQSDEVR